MRARTIVVVALAALVPAAWAQTSVDLRAQSGPETGLDSWTAVLRGVVTTDSGAPAPGAEVRLVGSGRHRLTTTDAAGRFVFTDLPTEACPPRSKRGAPTYYPGTPGVAAALPLEVETGSQVPVSISLGTVPLARVSGVLVNATGTPTAGNVTLLPEVTMAPQGPDDRASLPVFVSGQDIPGLTLVTRPRSPQP